MKLSNMSFKKQFYITLYVVGTVVIFFGFSLNIYSSYIYKKDAFMHESILQSSLIADNSIAPLMFFDEDGMQKNLAPLYRYKDILQVRIYDKDDKEFASYNPDNRESIEERSLDQSAFIMDKESVVFRYEIMENGEKYGTLYMEKSTQALKSFLYDYVFNTIIFSLALIIIMVIVVIKMSAIFITPIVSLSKTLVELSLTQDYDTRLDYVSDNEVGKLYGAFNKLFASIGVHQGRLENLTNELENRVQTRTQELQKSLDTLHRAQSQLVESEKMAALGSLVSGVAHEVNTPLGNAVTGSSIIRGECQELLKMMDNGTLKKSILSDKLMHLEEASRLLSKSVTNAADLIKSFKKISVDQSLEAKREFDPQAYINEVFLTFRNKLKQVPVSVDIVCKEKIVLNSFPGAFAQIFNNFIQNSIMHGFEHKVDNANIRVEIYTKEDKLCIVYTDNGGGADESIKKKIFEPFVTTKRNAGGTGLGLNIVYNIVTQKLLGTLLFDSELKKGVKFTIIIPM